MTLNIILPPVSAIYFNKMFFQVDIHGNAINLAELFNFQPIMVARRSSKTGICGRNLTTVNGTFPLGPP